MLNKNRQTKYNSRNFNSLINFKINYPLISLIIIFIMISYSIIDYNFLNDKPEINIREHNLEKIREFNLADLYNQKNLNHNQVRIWILNNTDQSHRKERTKLHL